MPRITLLLFLLISNAVSGQINIQNNTLHDVELNIIYIGLENEFQVSGLKNIRKTELRSTNENTEIIKKSRRNFVIKSRKIGIDTISLFQNQELIIKKIYQAKYIPSCVFEAILCNDTSDLFTILPPFVGCIPITSIRASAEEIINHPVFKVRLIPKFSSKKLPYVCDFILLVNPKNDSSAYYKSNTNHLNQKQIKAISKLQPEDELRFIIYTRYSNRKRGERRLSCGTLHIIIE